MSKFHFTIQRNQPDQFDRWPARAPHWIIYAENGLPVKDVHDVTTGQALEQLQTTVMEQAQEVGRLRDHLMNILTILDLTYVLPENMKQGFVEQSKIHAARAALQPTEGEG